MYFCVRYVWGMGYGVWGKGECEWDDVVELGRADKCTCTAGSSSELSFGGIISSFSHSRFSAKTKTESATTSKLSPGAASPAKGRFQ